MPQLYTFVACKKIIIDDSGIASLIFLFTQFTVSIPIGMENVPSNAAVPKEWAICSSWDWEPADEGKEYNQIIQILYPDGKSFVDRQETKFVMQPDIKQQIKAPMMGFPIGQQGTYLVRMWLEHAGRVIVEPRPIRLELKYEPPVKTP